MPRFFRLEEATRLLPEVGQALTELVRQKSDYDEANAELQQISRKVMLSGGMQVSANKVVDLRQRKQSSADAVKENYQRIQEIGCLLKDLNMGLIDFPTLYQGREVYLCWRLGEPRIEFWHGVDEGFRGRKPIDAEFVSSHSDH